MLSRLLFILIPLISFNTFSTTLLEQKLAALSNPNDDVFVVGHRACWSEKVPENSLLGIQRCIDNGIDIIEIDIKLTKDNVPVLLHDDTLDRTTKATGKVSDYTLEQIELLHLKQGIGGGDTPITKSHIPTLKEALLIAKDKILINLDVKGEYYEETFKVINELSMGNQIIMKMRALPTDDALLKASFLGQTHFMPISSDCNRKKPSRVCVNKLHELLKRYERFTPVAFEVSFPDIDFLKRDSQKIKKAGKRLWVNTLSPHHAAGIIDLIALQKPAETWGKLITSGATIIQTDYPIELKRYLKDKDLNNHNP